jgi:hypothetical protein
MVSGRTRLEAEEREHALRQDFCCKDTRSVHQLGKLLSVSMHSAWLIRERAHRTSKEPVA